MEENKKFFSLSDKASSEYCCCVVRIGEVKPIENSDFLATTDVYGTQVVVRKDQVKQGDIMFYAMNETELNSEFLHDNNLYDISNRNLNANADDVNAIMENYEVNYKSKADPLRAKMKQYKKTVKSMTEASAKLNKEIKNLKKKLETESIGASRNDIEKTIEEKQAFNDKKIADAMALTTKIANLKNQIEEINTAGKHVVDDANKMCGFFNQYGRVRCINLKGEPSFGYIFSKEEVARYNPQVLNVNLEDYLEQNFDTIDGKLFVKAYVPRVKEQSVKGSGRARKRNKKITQLERMVEGQFYFHYDTTPLDTRILKNFFNPEQNVIVDVKIHGTSVCLGKLLVKEPKKGFLGKLKVLWHKAVSYLNLPKLDCVWYNEIYGPVFSSRTVIKNQYINENVGSGYYKTDIWSEVGEKVYPYLKEGMTVYGEIFGYEGNRYIQKNYDYGCQVGEYKLMPYRITTTLTDGKKYEWNVEDVHNWTRMIMRESEEMNNLLHPIDILYHGTLAELYPEIDTTSEDWASNVYHSLSNDKEHFGMEENEPLCKNEVPREGICIRIDDDKRTECFKLKTQSFKFKEAILVDSGEVDFDNDYSNDNVKDNQDIIN